MYAIIETGGKQYRVEKGMQINIERLPNEVGSDVEFAQVLLVSGEGSEAKIGQPYVNGSKVVATIKEHLRDDKVLVFKKRSKKGYKKMQGHRQNLTQIEVKEIVAA